MNGLRSLESVQAVARRGSISAAALDLGMSTTALSHTRPDKKHVRHWRPSAKQRLSGGEMNRT